MFRMYRSMRALTALEERKKEGKKNPEGTVLRDVPLVDCTSFSSALASNYFQAEGSIDYLPRLVPGRYFP